MNRFVASIFFEEAHVDRSIYGGQFVLPAVTRGSPPFLLLVKDHIQIEQMPFIAGGGKVPRVIAGEHIAHDIYVHVATLGLGMDVNCGPGVWVVRDRVPETTPDGTWLLQADGKPQTREASEHERQAMFAEDLTFATSRQARYGEYLIAQGDTLDQNPKERVWITPRMRAACLYYAREREWLRALKDGDLKLCPYCVKSIDARAIKCPSCGEIVDVARHAALAAQRKQAEKEALRVT